MVDFARKSRRSYLGLGDDFDCARSSAKRESVPRAARPETTTGVDIATTIFSDEGRRRPCGAFRGR